MLDSPGNVKPHGTLHTFEQESLLSELYAIKHYSYHLTFYKQNKEHPMGPDQASHGARPNLFERSAQWSQHLVLSTSCANRGTRHFTDASGIAARSVLVDVLNYF